MRTGAELYLEGHTQTLIMSGGPGDGSISKPAAMKRYAQELGVPPDAILLDHDGMNTARTVRNCAEIMESEGFSTALMVSTGYHSPRVEAECERIGIHARTVPTNGAPMTKLPYFMARETLAQWVYFVRPLFS